MTRAESALTEAWQVEVDRVTSEGQCRVGELEKEVLRLRTQMEDERRRVNDVVGGEMKRVVLFMAGIDFGQSSCLRLVLLQGGI